MNTKFAELNDLTKAVRACFQRLRAFGEQLHRDLGVTVAARAVLETLVEVGPATVPDIARSKAVTRQHIQTIVDVLLEKGLAKPGDNPAHRRSSLIAATPKGTSVFAEIRRREQRALTAIVGRLSHADISTSLRTLTRLSDVLDDNLKERENAA